VKLWRLWGEIGESLRIAVSSLVAQRLRTFLTTMGMVIGVMTVIAIVAIIQGLNQSFAAQVANFGAHTIFVDKFKWVNTSDDWWMMRNRKNLGFRELEAIEREAQFAVAVAPVTRSFQSLRYRDKESTGIAVQGTSEMYPATTGVSVGSGRFLAEVDVAFERMVVVLGSDVVEELFGTQDPLGKRVLLGNVPFTVIGALERRGNFLGMSQDANVYVPVTTFRRVFGQKRSITIAVAAIPGKLDQLEDELTGILRRVRQVSPEKPDDFTLNRQEQLTKLYNQLTGALYGVAVGVGLITLIVGGIGIMNIMLVSVRERTREIGVRRAIGAKRRTILLQFLIEAALVAALGGSIGTILGLAASQLVALLTPLTAAVTPGAVALGLGFSAFVGLVFGSWPAWRAARLDPVEALRYE
jgi:putative ABC transport system permease protein